MTKPKTPKPLTINSSPNKVKDAIFKLETQLKTLDKGSEHPTSHDLYGQRARIKSELNALYKLRKAQKNRKFPTPKKPNYKKGW